MLAGTTERWTGGGYDLSSEHRKRSADPDLAVPVLTESLLNGEDDPPSTGCQLRFL